MDDRVIWNNCRKSGDVQSSMWGDISLKAEQDIIAGWWVREGVALKAWHMLPRERWSAVTLITPVRWEAVIQMSKCATKNDKVNNVTLKIDMVLRQMRSPDNACKYKRLRPDKLARIQELLKTWLLGKNHCCSHRLNSPRLFPTESTR